MSVIFELVGLVHVVIARSDSDVAIYVCECYAPVCGLLRTCGLMPARNDGGKEGGLLRTYGLMLTRNDEGGAFWWVR